MTTYNRNTWHGRLASVYGPLPNHGKINTNICKYVRAMLVGSFWLAVITAVLGAMAGLLGDSLAWCAAMIVQGQWITARETAMIWPALICTILAICLVGLICYAYEKGKQKVRQNRTHTCEAPSNSPVAVWYRSLKEKTCFNVTLS